MNQLIDKNDPKANTKSCFIVNNQFFLKSFSKLKEKAQKEDVILGKVFSVKDKVVVVVISYNVTKNCNMSEFAIIPIQNISKNFISDLKNGSLFNEGDIITAKIFEITKSDIILRTNESNLGVVLTQCNFCLKILLNHNNFICENCNFLNQKKLSKYYSL